MTLVVALHGVVSCRGGCWRDEPKVAAPATLALLPADARLVASVDFARIRATPSWSKVSELAAGDAADRKILDELLARTGLDPLRQVHRMVAAFPDDARASGRFALVIDGAGFDEMRLITYARDRAHLRGRDLVSRSYRRHTLWSSASAADQSVAGFFASPKRFVLGGGGWAEAMVDLMDAGATGKSAADNSELGNLCQRVDTGRSAWFCGVIPPDLRKQLLAALPLDPAASVTRLAAALDLGPGLDVDLTADLSNAADAKIQADKITAALRDARGSARVLMLGLGPYLDHITAAADGPGLRVHAALGETQVNDLLGRLGGLVRLVRPQ